MTNINMKGKVLFVENKVIYIARGYKIYKSIDNGQSWKVWSILSVNIVTKLIMSIPLLSRLLRKGISSLVVYNNIGIVIANKASYIVEAGTTKIVERLYGSNPMVLCLTNTNEVFYGEYRSNPERSVVNIWKLNVLNLKWETVWIFDSVRHVHGVFYDSFTDSIWVTTGDSNLEAAIWRTDDNFQSLQKIITGSQQTRAVQLLFSEDYIYYGSDAPDEVNYIYRMARDTKIIEQLQEVGSSIFYGTIVNGSYFFSTAVEPSECNTTKYVELWKSENGKDWHLYKKIKKDIWSMKYFQYGQISFPNSVKNNNLFFTLNATIDSGMTFLEKMND